MSTALVLVLGATVSADARDGDGPYPAVKVCDEIFSGGSARAIDSLSAAKAYRSYGSGGLDRVAGELKYNYSEFDGSVSRLCGFSGVGRFDVGITVDFSLYGNAKEVRRDKSLGYFSPWRDRDVYGMGMYADAGARNASLKFECLTPQVDSSGIIPFPVQGALEQRRNLPEEDDRTLRDANMTILHAAALAMAKKLGCENNGGIPAKVDLRVLKPADPAARY
ncbi:hypothetical protein AB0O07_16195 [Streptomyces sp. NPDC093085]|uniref:hypothetical protein n=1 Tax=Streptomyces sp. NPDC093085 TaxID=3155068 RepID=UPI003413133B